ncbi:helix-turn-helix transcriptional regulator [Brevibacillus ruminantium]|uniref:Helix-turn-helix transcriptional regulator n=1 Tax=Brevibacillus ruminantium TaxID=2950604 RepID=A0ABY4WED6_9BACL|nr:helix-turn-helix transcriptional regulator [Brevibacillus ruminantium]USG64493.1 helix-turn-helix transcriptional regulator [Brevibacillus ruminantium]
MTDTQNQSRTETVTHVIGAMKKDMENSSFTLNVLAKIAMYSPFHFNRMFQSVTGVTARQFLAALRLDRAKEYLATSDLPITEIGQQVGYNSYGTFSTRFAKLVGLSPQQFRQQVDLCKERMRAYYERKRDHAPLPAVYAGLSGTVAAPENFEGPICIGLFTKPIPMGPPVACTMVFQSGSFWIPPVPDGTYYLLSAAFTWDDPLMEYFLPRNNLRGKAAGAICIKEGQTLGETDIVLRPPRVYDPPIHISLPLLIHQFLNKAEGLEQKGNGT